MKTIYLPLTIITLLFAAACSSESGVNELDTSGASPTGLPNAGGGDTQHSNDPNAAANGATFQQGGGDTAVKIADRAIVGTPELAARLHSCGKITYSALGQILKTRGVNITSTASKSAGELYTNGGSALGIANYDARVPEATFSSTSAISKQMDIFAQAANEITNANWAPAGCAGAKMFGADGLFTKDGITCIIGKPAKDEHVALANQLVAQAADPATGKKLAISALLSAAHVCE